MEKKMSICEFSWTVGIAIGIVVGVILTIISDKCLNIKKELKKEQAIK